VIARKRRAYDVPVSTPGEVLRAHLSSIDAGGAPTLELSLRGVPEEDELFTLTSIGDRWSVERGGAESAAFTVSAHWADLIDLIEGYGSLEAAMIDGRVKIAGDLLLAMRWVPRLLTSSGSR
jgi:putative sterol carrier protein